MMITVFLAVSSLYLAREVLIPLAMAVLLAFLLALPVSWLERRRVPRVPAVLAVICTIFSAAATIGWIVYGQLHDLAARLPTYKEHLQQRLDGLRLSGGIFDEVQRAFGKLSGNLERNAENVQPVRIVSDAALPFEQIKLVLATSMAPLAGAAIVLVLVIFLLLNREDMRNRLVRLAGSRLALTTRTLDEVGSRISRYLLLNSLVNGAFGILVAIGLAVVGVECAATWGLLAAVLRFVPYLGPILAASLPIGLAIVQFPGPDWLHPLLAAAVFIVLELITNNVVEPLVYGPSTGVSTVALILSAMFWTWIWGPLGLVLAIPLTVVCAVLGEYVEALEPLAILLSDKPALAGSITYYQRLLANDAEEAATIFEASRSASSLLEAYDTVVIPAFVLAQKERESGELLEPEQQFIWQATQEIVDDEETRPAVSANSAKGAAGSAAEADLASQVALNARVVGCAAHDIGDEIALRMLKQAVVVGTYGAFEILPTTLLASEVLSALAANRPDAVCISSVGFQGGQQTRYLCKRIRQNFPEIEIIVGRWGQTGGLDKLAQNLKARGADQVVTSLVDARDALQRLTHLDSKIEDEGQQTRVDAATGASPPPATAASKLAARAPLAS